MSSPPRLRPNYSASATRASGRTSHRFQCVGTPFHKFVILSEAKDLLLAAISGVAHLDFALKGALQPLGMWFSNRRRATPSPFPTIMQMHDPSNRRLSSTTASDVILISSMRANAVAANSCAPIVFGSRVMQSSAVRSSASLPRCPSSRRKSPSLITPSKRSPSTTAVIPSFLRDIS